MSWEGSTRHERLPADWPQRRAYVLRRDGYRCTVTRADDTRCPSAATDVDHIKPGDAHHPSNLRAICEWHHDRKSGSEGGRAASARRIPRKRPTEPHPGDIA